MDTVSYTHLVEGNEDTGLFSSQFIGEVPERNAAFHRFNKAQQDAFLPFVEKGSIILIGATTENPLSLIHI